MSRLGIELVHDGRQVTRVAIRPRRLAVERLIEGRTPDAAMAQARIVFAVCPMAQARALALALEAAGAPVKQPVAAETARAERLVSTICRLALIPVAGEVDGALARMAIAAACAGDWPALIEAGGRASSRARRIADRLSADPVAVRRPLGRLSAEAAFALLAGDPEVQLYPTLDGAPRDASPVPGASPRARLHAVADRLGGAPRDMEESCWGEANAGAAVVPTARGPLAVAVWIEEGRVTRYRSVAPTEWTFHPEGVLADALVGRPATAATLALAEDWATALDACVPTTIAFRSVEALAHA
jgi:hypothetical protein